MKKMTLLFTILCAGQLYGMEPELNPAIWGQEQLPNDVKTLVMVTLAQSGDNLDLAINNIKKASLINKTLNQMINAAYGNLQGFTKLVHMLADKFDKPTKTVAEKFGTPVAKQYIELGDLLISKIGLIRFYREGISEVTQLIKNGADVNYSAGGPTIKLQDPELPQTSMSYTVTENSFITPMWTAVRSANLKTVKLLLNFGAKPESDEYYSWSLSDIVANQAIKQLLDEARMMR